MKKELVIYGVSVGINRGAILILMPFLLHIFTVQDFGLYSYVQLLFQLGSPIVSLNVIIAMSREGADHPSKALYIYNNFLLTLLFITMGLAAFCYLLTLVNVEFIYVWILLLAGVEAWHNMLLSYYRAAEKNWIFLFFSILKTLGLLLVFSILYWQVPNASLNYYLLIQFIWSLVIGFLFHIGINKRTEAKDVISLKESITSSLVLIPHTLSLWIIASAGRFFLKELWGNYELGVYSKVFNVAMILMIVNSGIGIALPQQIIKNYKQWIVGSIRSSFFKYYSVVAIILYFLLIVGIWFDINYFQLYNIDFYKNGFNFLLIYVGFYLLGFYYVYSNILFALRKNKILALITTVTAVLSVMLNYILILNFKMLGASVSVVTTYLIYYFLTFFYTLKYEKQFKKSKSEIYIVLAVTSALFLLTWLFGAAIN